MFASVRTRSCDQYTLSGNDVICWDGIGDNKSWTDYQIHFHIKQTKHVNMTIVNVVGQIAIELSFICFTPSNPNCTSESQNLLLCKKKKKVSWKHNFCGCHQLWFHHKMAVSGTGYTLTLITQQKQWLNVFGESYANSPSSPGSTTSSSVSSPTPATLIPVLMFRFVCLWKMI